MDEVLSTTTCRVGRPRRDTSVSNATPSKKETRSTRRSKSATQSQAELEVMSPTVNLRRVHTVEEVESSDDEQSPARRGHNVNAVRTRGQHPEDAVNSGVHTARQAARHSTRLESTKSHGTTGETRARGSVELVPISTRASEDADHPGGRSYTRGLSRPAADDVPSSRLAPQRREPDESRRGRGVSGNETQSVDLHARHAGTGSGDNDDCTRLGENTVRPQDRHIGTRSGVQDTLCEASGGGGRLTLREFMGIAAALEVGSSEWYAVMDTIQEDEVT